MLEIGILLGIMLTLVGTEFVLWRLIGGPPRTRWGNIARVLVLFTITIPILTWSAWRLSKSRELQLFGEMVTCADTSRPVVALTFDDGPAPGYTEEVLAILRQEGVSATFFVTGKGVEENMPEAEHIVAEGHELGNHSYSHVRMIARSPSFVQDEVERTDELIRAAGYSDDIHFRPPYGKRLIVLPYYLSRTGRTTILFDVQPDSYPEIAADAEMIVGHVLDGVRPGSIILLHVMNERRGESLRAVPGIIAGLRDRGYEFVTISELLALDGEER